MNKNRGFDNAQVRWPWTNPHKYCSCGVQSLHHAMLLLGMPSNLSELLQHCPIHKNVGFGHEVPLLMALAKLFGARPENLTNSKLRSLRGAINRSLKMGSPVILGSDSEIHWLVLAGFDGNGGYVWIDSADEPLSGTWDWEEIEDWLAADGVEIDALAICPGSGDGARRSMVPHIDGIYELLTCDEALSGEWGLYLDDLDTVFNFAKTRGATMEAETFFGTNEEAIVQPVLWMNNNLEEDVVRDVYANYRAVANFHSLSLPACFEAHVVAHMAMVLKDSVA